MIGEPLDFQHIHDTFRPKITRYLTRLVGEAESEDLAQEVLLKVSRGLNDFRGEAQLSTWIYRITTNAALDRIESPSYQRAIQTALAREGIGSDESEVEDRDVWTGETTPSPEATAEREEMYECFRGRLALLPADYRTVLALSDLEEFSNQEIAEILGVSVEVVKIRLHRARAKLRQDLLAFCKPEEWIPEE